MKQLKRKSTRLCNFAKITIWGGIALEVVLFLLCAIWLFGLTYLGIATIVIKYREREKCNSVIHGLRTWMVSCINDCNFEKAFRIQIALSRYDGNRIHYKDFLKSYVYPMVFENYRMARAEFNEATNVDVDTAVYKLSVAEQKLDLTYRTIVTTIF